MLKSNILKQAKRIKKRLISYTKVAILFLEDLTKHQVILVGAFSRRTIVVQQASYGFIGFVRSG